MDSHEPSPPRWVGTAALILLILWPLCGPRSVLAAQLRDLLKHSGRILENLPELSELLADDPLTTSFDDAAPGFALLDHYHPSRPNPLEDADRNLEGAFLLERGSYRGVLQSFCLKPGTHGPGGGDGYLSAPLRGPQSDIVLSILRNSAFRTDVSQNQIQALLWAVVSKADLDSLPPDLVWLAKDLLSPGQLIRFGSGAVGWIPDDLFRKYVGSLPRELRGPLEAEEEIRKLLRSGDTRQRALERIAILTGAPRPGRGTQKIPAFRWSYRDGYFVRYEPSDAKHTGTEILIPGRMIVETDALGRIAGLEDDSGNRIEVDYEPNSEPFRLASDPGLSGHAFRTIRFLNSRHSGSDSLFEWTDVGWTWSGCPDPSRKAPGPGSGTRAVFADWRQEFELATVRCDELAGFLEKSGLNPGRRPAAALFNLAHFVDSIRAATSRFDSSKRLEIESHRELPYRALAWKVCLSIGDCGARGQSQQVVEFDPAEQVAVPGNTGRQRLGLSARLH